MISAIKDNCSMCGQMKGANDEYCPACIYKAKAIGATIEITRRAKERNLPLNKIIEELIIYAFDKEKEDADKKIVV